MIEVKNPTEQKILYTLEETSEETMNRVYQQAHEAFSRIQKLSLGQRIAQLGKLQQTILENRERIVSRLIQETGKARLDALVSEIFAVLDVITYLRQQAQAMLGDQVVKTPLALMGKRSVIYYEPLGIVLVISPWNYPFYLALVPTLSAFVAGNAVVYKPSEVTPLKGLLEDLWQKSGLLENAIQVVYGSGLTGERLIAQAPAKIFFTGSVATGKKIMAQAASQLIPVELELGGKDAMVVFADVDWERTTSGAIWGAFTNSGQSCTSVERLYVQEPIYDSFVNLLEQKIRRLRVGPGDSTEVDIGCMTAEFQLQIVQRHLAEATDKGARILTGGSREEGTMRFPPTLVVDVDPTMALVQEETFGPVLPVIKFSSEEEVIGKVNASPLGLSASVWSRDLERAQRVARALQVGNVSINNVMLTEGNPHLPFGGVKHSGFGRTKGEIGLRAFTHVKSVMIDKQSPKIEAHWYPYTQRKYTLFQNLIEAFFRPSLARLPKVILRGLRLEKEAQKKSHSMV